MDKETKKLEKALRRAEDCIIIVKGRITDTRKLKGKISPEKYKERMEVHHSNRDYFKTKAASYRDKLGLS
jgi:hypothetical protein